jgi:hypothetical protein
METKITDADIERLCRENPLASEQLRRIISERQTLELKAELDELKLEAGRVNGKDQLPQESPNGVVDEAVLAEQ